MKEVTMLDVRSYLKGEVQPGFLNFLEKKRVRKIEELIASKINFILESKMLIGQLPDHPCSDSMFPVFRDKFFKGELSQSSEWFRILSSPTILHRFAEITPDFLTYVPREVLIDNSFLIRFQKYNPAVLTNIIRSTFQSYDQIITYSFTGHDLNFDWFFQNITNQTNVNAFAPNTAPNKETASFKTKQLDTIQLWSLNAELYLDKIRTRTLTPAMFSFPEEKLSIDITPGFIEKTQCIKKPNFTLESDDRTNPEKISPIFDSSDSDSVRHLNFALIDEHIIGREALYYIGGQVIKVRIQNLSYNFKQIYLQVLEDTYPGSEIMVIDAESISHQLTDNQAWINPDVFKLIA